MTDGTDEGGAGGAASFSLAGRVVLVTGAGRGLGRGMALAALRAGATVAGVSRSADQLQETAAAAGGRADRFVAVPHDLRDPASLDGLVERVEAEVGPVHGVVHAAGVQLRKPAVDVSAGELADVLRMNLEVPFLLSTAVGRRQIAAGRDGSHVLIGSLTSSIAVKGIAPYTAAKSGLLGVMRSLAVEWAELGIRVNALGPGYYHTALTADVLADEVRRASILSRIPMGRLGEADDLAGAAVFLLSPASAYVTGQLLGVDGGWLAG